MKKRPIENKMMINNKLHNLSFQKHIKWLRKSIKHQNVIQSVITEGKLTWQLMFFTFISSCIVTLGLLLNSPAVIIGAMLISPLMPPIASQGFGLATLDTKLFKSGSLCIFFAIFVAIFSSFLLVFLSPISEITPEIIARTNPSLFDLLIAALAGLASGYSLINQQQTSIVGVAIATSLMPPLTVTGFGFATGNFWIARGSFFLFITNLVAICVSIFFMAKIYGFKKPFDRHLRVIPTLIVCFALISISIPLSISLKEIAFQSHITKISKKEIEFYFDRDFFDLSNFSASFIGSKVNIYAVITTKYYRNEAQEEISKKLKKLFNRDIALRLVQVGLADDYKELENKKLDKINQDKIGALKESYKDKI